MSPLRRWLPLVCSLVLVVTCAPSRAEEPRDTLRRSQQAQGAAPVCRMTVVSTDIQANKSGITIIETVKPSQSHLQQVRDGKLILEMFSDGKKTLVRREDGAPFAPAPESATAMMADLQRSSSLQAMAAAAGDLKVAGHEAINGQAATIYSCSTDLKGVHVATKLWISDQDALPLKAEGFSSGEVDTGSGIPQQTNQHSRITYSYDPAITITLPEAG